MLDKHVAMIGMRSARAILVCITVAALVGGPSAPPAVAAEPDASSPIEHVLVLMQEDHTFDNYFGTFPGADGPPPEACMPIDPASPDAGCLAPYHLDSPRTIDLHHGSSSAAKSLNGGEMDGFIEGQNERNLPGRLAMGYYDGRDLPLYWNLATDYVLADRFFSSVLGSSEANHNYWVAARGLGGPVPANGYTFPTIFDLLEAAGVSWKFYVQRYDPAVNYRNRQPASDKAAQLVWVPILSHARFLDDLDLNSKIVDMSEYFEDLANDTLPAVSFMVPNGASEHPPGDVSLGQVFATSLVTSLMRSPSWDRSLFVITWDDWGGWYDHVVPPQIDADGYGFRVPALFISPYAKRGVDSTTYDFTSILRFIEENWHLQPLTARDATANSLRASLDFGISPSEPRIPGDAYPNTADIEARNRDALSLVYAVVVALVIGAFVVASLRVRRRTSGGDASAEVRS